MGLFNKKADPLTVRSKELNAKISALENQIRQLESKAATARPQPRVKASALPKVSSKEQHAGPALTREPIFERLEPRKAEPAPEIETTAAHYNELGMRKFDLLAAFRRLQRHFKGPPASNPKLVSYLAAGSIKGLRPLRYEKRVARNRFIVLSIFFVFVLWGILAVIFNHR